VGGDGACDTPDGVEGVSTDVDAIGERVGNDWVGVEEEQRKEGRKEGKKERMGGEVGMRVGPSETEGWMEGGRRGREGGRKKKRKRKMTKTGSFCRSFAFVVLLLNCSGTSFVLAEQKKEESGAR
jgi:hypothetical protein